MGASVRLNGLQDNRNTLTTTDASRADSVLQSAIRSCDLVGQVAEDTRTRGTRWVTKRDGAAVNIANVGVEAELLFTTSVRVCTTMSIRTSQISWRKRMLARTRPGTGLQKLR